MKALTKGDATMYLCKWCDLQHVLLQKLIAKPGFKDVFGNIQTTV